MVEETKKKFIPQGVKKGGSRFPRQTLETVLPWVSKLVSKTHLSPQPKDLILSGVIGVKNSRGEVRLSTLKQFGFLGGDSAAYTASDLAKKIASAPSEELLPLYAESVLRPAVFKALFDTFHGDEVTKAKLKQRAFDLGVHPEESETCVEIYAASLAKAGLVTVDGDKVIHRHASAQPNGSISPAELPDPSADEETTVEDGLTEDEPEENLPRRRASQAKAAINVSITLDASLDSDKLEKQLRLLRKYGAI